VWDAPHLILCDLRSPLVVVHIEHHKVDPVSISLPNLHTERGISLSCAIHRPFLAIQSMPYERVCRPAGLDQVPSSDTITSTPVGIRVLHRGTGGARTSKCWSITCIHAQLSGNRKALPDRLLGQAPGKLHNSSHKIRQLWAFHLPVPLPEVLTSLQLALKTDPLPPI
jgi:hypothetical protein